MPSGQSYLRLSVNFFSIGHSPEFSDATLTMQTAATSEQYRLLHPLFNRLLCTPATSAPVERIFSQSGIIMRPHRAKMSDSLLETLVMLKCNSVWQNSNKLKTYGLCWCAVEKQSILCVCVTIVLYNVWLLNVMGANYDCPWYMSLTSLWSSVLGPGLGLEGQVLVNISDGSL